MKIDDTAIKYESTGIGNIEDAIKNKNSNIKIMVKIRQLWKYIGFSRYVSQEQSQDVLPFQQ